MSAAAHGTHRVVVIGAGFGGLRVVRGLDDPRISVTLVDANNFHTFQPLLYQVATAGLDAGDVAYPVRSAVQRRRNVRIVMDRVVDIDVAARHVLLDRSAPLDYDSLVVAAGAISNDLGIDGVDEHGLPLKSVDDALAIRAHLLDRFESTAVDPSLVDDGSLDVVISGGGPTGVEMAGGVAELFGHVLRKDFPELPVERAHIVLVEPMERLLSGFSEASSREAERTLERRGVEVCLGVGVASASAARVRLTDGRELRAHTLVWAAGVRAHPIAAALGTPRGRGGRLEVNSDLSLPGHPEVFAIGDIAAMPSPDGDDRPLPQVAPPAIQGGRYVAEVLRARVAGQPAPPPFEYTDKGSMATIGRNKAVTELPNGWRFGGRIGWIAWLGLHLVQLMGFRNRLNVFVNWCWNYVTYDRASRLLPASERDETRRRRAAQDDGTSTIDDDGVIARR